MSKPHGNSVDDYLEVIYFLTQPIGELKEGRTMAIAARVADMLGVSRAAVGEMLKRLTSDGLLERGGRELKLTTAGTERAEGVVRRHRIIERFLTDFLGYTAAESHEQADVLGSSFTDEMVDRMYERLGSPDRCPHGWPVDPADERAENVHLTTLADLAPGETCSIVRLAEHNGDLLSWFYEVGLVPGVDLSVHDVKPAAGHLTVGLEGTSQLIAEKAARNLLVRKAAA